MIESYVLRPTQRALSSMMALDFYSKIVTSAYDRVNKQITFGIGACHLEVCALKQAMT